MEVFKDVNIISWNIWGVVNDKGCWNIKELVMFILLETRCLFAYVESFWEWLDFEVQHLVEASSHSGGFGS